MHKKWEITCFLTAKILNGKWVSLGGVEESFPSLTHFHSPALTMAGDSQRSRCQVPIRRLKLSSQQGMLFQLLGREQQPDLSCCDLTGLPWFRSHCAACRMLKSKCRPCPGRSGQSPLQRSIHGKHPCASPSPSHLDTEKFSGARVLCREESPKRFSL